MSHFNIYYHQELELIKEKPFRLEEEIQQLTENNLGPIFGLEFVKSEFSVGKFRIDTLAYNPTSSSFVIIEIKRDKSFSVVDQGYAYLSLMLNNKSDFILEYNENNNSQLKRGDIDWSQSRVVFISPAFTTYQKEAINFKDLPIELWEIRRYGNNTVSYTQVQTVGSHESIKTISRSNTTVATVSKEIKVYTEQEHIEECNEEIKELYEKLKAQINNLGIIELKPKKKYIAFMAESNITDIVIQRKAIKLFINLTKGQLDDPKKIARDVSAIGHWGNGDYEIQIKDDEDLEYIMSLIKQSFNRNKK